MRKSLLFLASIGAWMGPASAQSTVLLYGIVDVNVRWVENDLASGRSDSRKTMSNDGLRSSRLGVRGFEDLGGGLRAGFWIESSLAADTGTNPQTRFWHRRATVSLLGPFGEVRLGRDNTPTSWNPISFDVFSTIGVASSISIANFNATPNLVPPAAAGTTLSSRTYPSGTIGNYTRSDNQISYFLPPNLGGVHGQVSVAAGEGAAGKYRGGRIGWAKGPAEVALAYGRTDADAAGIADFTMANVGASYDLRVVKLVGQFSRDKLDVPTGADPVEKRLGLGLRIPVGAGEIKASFIRSQLDNGGANNDDARLFGIGYVHNLSKRTALYATAARIDNKGVGAMSIAGGPPGQRRGGESTGVEAGLSHTF